MIITVICIDCMRRDCLTKDMAPRMYAFAEENVQFTDAWAAGPATIPSVHTFFAGVPTGTHGGFTTGMELRVNTFVEFLKGKGFQTVCYNANGFFKNALERRFHEYHALNWMCPEREKRTQDSYDAIWNRIDSQKGDAFFYVHLMDVHPPYRYAEGISAPDFPGPMTAFELVKLVNEGARKKQAILNPEQWDKLWTLLRAEIRYVDSRLRFPGDVVVLTSDHGEMFNDTYEGGHWWSHAAKHFTLPQLQIPFVARGLGDVDADMRFCTMDFGKLLRGHLEGQPWKGPSDLYWEDYWYDTVHRAIRLGDYPILSVGSDGQTHYGENRAKLDDVPGEVKNYLLAMIAKYDSRLNVDATDKPDEKLVEDRLRALGYI